MEFLTEHCTDVSLCERCHKLGMSGIYHTDVALVNDVTEWEFLTEHCTDVSLCERCHKLGMSGIYHTDVALCERCHRMGISDRALHWCCAVCMMSQNDARGGPEGQHGSVAGQQVVPSLERQLCGTSGCCKGSVFCCCFFGFGFVCFQVFCSFFLSFAFVVLFLNSYTLQ